MNGFWSLVTHKGRVVPLVIFLIFTSLMMYVQIDLYNHWTIRDGDVGQFAQMAEAAYHNQKFFYGGNVPYFAVDGSFTLWLLGPLVHFFGVYTMIAVESLAIGLTGMLVYGYCRRHLTVIMSTFIVAIYYVSPSILSQAAWGFDPLVLTMVGFTAFVYLVFTERENSRFSRWRSSLAWVLFLFALLSKGEAGLVGIGLGVTLILSQGKRKLGVVAFALSFLWLGVYEGIIIPSVFHGADPNAQHNWGYMGTTTHDKVLFLISHPNDVIQSLKINSHYILLLVGIFIPFLALSAKWILPVAPVVAGNVLSHFTASTDVTNEYSFFIVPFLAFSVADSVSWFKNKGIGARHYSTLLLYAGFGAALSTLPGITDIRNWMALRVPLVQAHSLSAALATVPKTSLLITPDLLGGHAAHFAYYEVAENGLSGVQSSVNSYLSLHGITHTYAYFLCTASDVGDIDLSRWAFTAPGSKVLFKNNGVYLVRIPVKSEVALSPPALTPERQFVLLLRGSQLYAARHGTVTDLSPLVLERDSLLPLYLGGFTKNLPTWNWTLCGGWAGMWTSDSDYAVGVNVDPDRARGLIMKYGARSSQMYYPYPNPIQNHQIPTTSTPGLLLMVFHAKA